MEFYLARDLSGCLYLYEDPPKKKESVVWFAGGCAYCDVTEVLDDFADIKWEDKEPTKIEINLVK